MSLPTPVPTTPVPHSPASSSPGHASSLLAALDDHAILSVADAQGRIVYVSQGFSELSGYSVAELLGGDHRRLKSGLHTRGFYERMWRRLATGQVWRGELCNRNKSGALYWVDTAIVPVADPHGQPLHYVAIRTDITSRKQPATSDGETSNEALARLSHALRTPLNTVLGYTQALLPDHTLAQHHAQIVAEIHSAGRQMLAALDQDWSPDPTGQATPTDKPEALSGEARVLYIEDDSANLKLVQSMLGLLPHLSVTGASTGAQGLALARLSPPDLILLDIHLPDTTGPALLAELRQLPELADTPIVAISADAMPSQVEQGLAAGFDDYIVKPFDMHQLLRSVQTLIVRRRI